MKIIANSVEFIRKNGVLGFIKECYARLVDTFYEKYFFRVVLRSLRKAGRNLRGLLIVGAGELGYDFYESVVENPQFGYRIVGFLDDIDKDFLNGQYLG